ncbi:MAG: hypothetical protein AB7F89_27225 [Pirellulaceae bacterium]
MSGTCERLGRLGASVLAVALLAAGPAAADVNVTGTADAMTFTLTSQSHVLTGEIASPRGRRERLLLNIATVTRETLGEKGIEGMVEVAARVAERHMPLLYTLRLPGRTAALGELGLLAIDLDDCCALHQSYHDPATGERLFETTVPTAALTLEGPTFRRRVAAFVAMMDGREDHRFWGDTAVGLITYAAADRTIRQIVVRADTATKARRLRSLDDERTTLAWVDGRTGAPIVTAPGQASVQPILRLHFITSDIEVKIPLKDDDLVPDKSPAGLTLLAQREPAIAGGWRVASAVAAPWASSAPAQELKDRYILFARDAVRSAGSVFDCGHATYERSAIPAEGLFQGAGVTTGQAAALGLDKPLSPSFTLTCDTGVFTFHRTPDGRWLTALDNVIYGLERAVE